MTWDVSGWAALVGIVAAIVGVFTALDGLTASARDRRLAEFLRDEAAAEGATTQGRILVSLRRTVIARLVARDAVPYWQESIPRAVASLSIAAAVLFGWSAPPDLPRASMAFVGLLLATLLLGSFMVVGVAKDTRRMISDAYLDGAPELAVGTRLKGASGLKLLARAVGMSLSAATAAVVFGRMFTHIVNAIEGLVFLISLVLLIWLWILGFRTESWVHPRSTSSTQVSEAPSATTQALVQLPEGMASEAHPVEDQEAPS